MIKKITLLIIFNLALFALGNTTYAQDCSANAGGNFVTCSDNTVLNGAVIGNIPNNSQPTWTFISGPTTPVIANPNNLSTAITGMTLDGQYTFRLTQNCNTGVAVSDITVTAHPRPSNFTAGNDINGICATVGVATLNGTIPSGFTGKWTILNAYELHRFSSKNMKNATIDNANIEQPTVTLIKKANHDVDPSYYAILEITSLDGICTFSDTAMINFLPNTQILISSQTHCRNIANTRLFYNLDNNSPILSNHRPEYAGSTAKGTTITLNVFSQPTGGNMALDYFYDQGIYFTGMDVNGTYSFTLTLSNNCGTYTTPVTNYTFTNNSPLYPSYIDPQHPEQMMVFSFANSGGELKCNEVVNTMTNDTIFYTINPLDLPSVVSVTSTSGIAPPGGYPTIQDFGANTYNRFAVVTPPAGGWQVGTYKFDISLSNGSCTITSSYYIHVSDNNRDDVFFPDVSVCYPGNGAISAKIPLPAAYKGIVNTSYFQDFNALYRFTVISRPAGSSSPVFAPSNNRNFTTDSTTISNLDKPGDYVIRGVIEHATGGQAPFIVQEFECSDAATADTFIIHVENSVNSNAGSDQSGICAQASQLVGNLPGLNDGTWEIIARPTGALPTIDNPSDPNTWIRGMDSIGEYLLTWTISSPFEGCISVDTVSLLVTCALPLELLDFNGTNTINRSQSIKWVTTSEEDIRKISLEHSVNTNEWDEIHHVYGADSTNGFLNYYEFINTNPNIGYNYYRLNIHNPDGSNQYSKILKLNYIDIQQAINVYPNPTNEYLMVQNLPLGGYVKIYNSFGILLQTNAFDKKSNKIDVTHIQSGVYILKAYNKAGETIGNIKWSKY